MFEPYLADYRYYALFEHQTAMSDVGIALGLFRSVSAGHEQRYRGHGVWERSRALASTEERDSYADYREVSAAELERLTRLADERASPRPEEEEPAAVVVLLTARRRAEPVDGHYHFALFDELADVVDTGRAQALLRCPASGDGQWETFLREGGWVPSEEPRGKHVLPVGREETGRISRMIETVGVRPSPWRFGVANLGRRPAPDGRGADDLRR